MSPQNATLAVFCAAVGLAAGAAMALVAMAMRGGRAAGSAGAAEEAGLRAGVEAFDRALLLLTEEHAILLGGEAALAACAGALGVAVEATAIASALERVDPWLASAVAALRQSGSAFDRVVSAPGGDLDCRGRAAGALALLSLSLAPTAARPAGPLRDRADLSALVDAHTAPAFATGADGQPVVVNRAWLDAVGAASLEEARAQGLAFDRGALDLAREAAATGAPLERVRWSGSGPARRALRLRATPLEAGGAAVWSWDVTAAEGASDALARHAAAQTLVLDQVADAVAIYDADKRLTFHNAAFSRLWDLEPAWLADRPSHMAVLDRLRQRRRLPEVADYGRFKADELARHERLGPAPEAVWRVAGERTLRVLSLPHPAGGLIQLFSDITPEMRLKSQFNHLIQVQQATLDKLTDAVAVFGPDGRLKLHNEAFQSLWAIPTEALAGEPPFDEIVDRCVVQLHDMHFWSELKGRITDPDPGVRAAVSGEARTSEGRRMAWQSRPLPDGATLVSFADVTATRRLEGALRDREAALTAAEDLKRDFVSSVSYELRTPLTTILGYAELLERGEETLSPRARSWVAAVRAAAADLARSVEDILAFAEIDAGEMSLQMGDTDVGALLESARVRWSERAIDGAVALEIQPGEAPGDIRADAESLARVLDHLIEHALRQTPPGGRVTLSARRSRGEVCLEVADTGRGIPFHVQAHIFDRFSGEEGAGAGLGLALVKALVELHGGWVAVESEPGAGAAFACHLPEAGQVPDEASVLI